MTLAAFEAKWRDLQARFLNECVIRPDQIITELNIVTGEYRTLQDDLDSVRILNPYDAIDITEGATA